MSVFQAISLICWVRLSIICASHRCPDSPTARIVNNASTNPSCWVRKAETGWPCITWAKAVVIPQVGQGYPRRMMEVQAGYPSCWCVPTPRLSGVSQDATPKSVRDAARTAVATVRATEGRAATIRYTIGPSGWTVMLCPSAVRFGPLGAGNNG